MIRLARASAVAGSALAAAAVAIALAAPARDAGPGVHVTAVSAATTSGQVTSARPARIPAAPARIPAMPHTLLPVVTAIPSPAGSIGDPGVPCLNGYVWRQAYPGDYVCVTPASRSQAAADDAAAVSRVAPGGGLFGTYTCKQGYVWRQVVPTDYVCVTPGVRSQAAYDNSRAGDRTALLSLWASR
jgi:hypothetical protein